MSLILTPRVSEKSIGMAERGVYVFDVPASTNKHEVAKAVAAQYKVEVTDVNILIHKGKLKRFRRVLGRQSDTKKAMVKVKAGQSIALFEGAQ